MLAQLLTTYHALAPELLLVGGAMALLMYGVFRPETEGEAGIVTWLAIAVLTGAIVLVLRQSGTIAMFDNSVVIDPFARFIHK